MPLITTETFNSLATATLALYDKNPQDQIFVSVPTLNIIRERGRMKEVPGGTAIRPALLYEPNSTVMSYSGAESLDTAEQDGMTRATFPWRFYNASTVITDVDIDQNAGDKTKLFDLLDEKMEQTELSFADRIASDLFKVQAGKNLDGFRTIIGDSAGTVGGHAESSNPWWAPQRQTSGVTSLNLRDKLRTLRNDARKWSKRGSRQNYFWIFTQELFEEYEDQIEDRARYQLSAEMQKMGFGLDDTLVYKGDPVLWDEYADGGVGDQRAWYINTDFLYLVVHPKRNFSTGPMRTPIDQHISVAHTRFMGNFVTNHRRALAVSHDITL